MRYSESVWMKEYHWYIDWNRVGVTFWFPKQDPVHYNIPTDIDMHIILTVVALHSDL
jgi:hypothetical protein